MIDSYWHDTIFTSDWHMGSPGFEDSRELLIDFLGQYAGRFRRIELLGDILELAGCSFDQALQCGEPVLQKLDEISRSAEVVYRLGNHDIGADEKDIERFRRTFPKIKVCEPEWRRVIIRKSVGNEWPSPKEVHMVLTTDAEINGGYAGHGDIHDHYFSTGDPRKWDWIVKLGDSIERVGGFVIRNNVARTFKQNLMREAEAGATAAVYLSGLIGGSAREQELAARDLAEYEVHCDRGVWKARKRSKPLDFVVMGHTHVRTEEPKPIFDDVLEQKGKTGAFYMNTGSWKYGNSGFAEINRYGRPQVFQWSELRRAL